MVNLDDEDKGKREEIIFSKNTKVNTILYESKHYCFIFIACEKGLYIQKIKGKSCRIDNSEECISLCFDVSKDYLFAGFKSGIIKVFNIKKKKSEKNFSLRNQRKKNTPYKNIIINYILIKNDNNIFMNMFQYIIF